MRPHPYRGKRKTAATTASGTLALPGRGIQRDVLGWINAAGGLGHDVDLLASKIRRMYDVRTGREIIRELARAELVKLSDDGGTVRITAKGVEELG